MTSVPPHDLKSVGRTPLSQITLANPHDTQCEGPKVQRRRAKRVDDGLLRGWSQQHAAAFTASPKPFSSWELNWGEAEDFWENNVTRETCATPEDVVALLPQKWLAFQFEAGDSEATLARICSMCTALVNKYVALSTTAPPKTTSQWRERETLHRRITAIVELLEASLGEDIPIVSLKDPNFMSSCWSRITEEDQSQLVAALQDAEDEEY